MMRAFLWAVFFAGATLGAQTNLTLREPPYAEEPDPNGEELIERTGFFNTQMSWEPGHMLPRRWLQPLNHRGLDYELVYTSAGLANVSGGLARGSTFSGVLEAGLAVDAQTMFHWPGAWFYGSCILAHGPNFSTRYTGDLYQGNTFSSTAGVRLYEVWYDQSLFNDHLSLRVGQIAADQEFVGTDVGPLIMNSTFGWPSIIGMNVQCPSYPIAAPGARLRLDLPHFWLQSAVYTGDIDPVDDNGKPLNQHGTRFNFNSKVFAMFEAGYSTVTEEHNHSYPGVYKVGAWLATDQFDDLYYDDQGGSLGGFFTTGNPRQLKGNWGWYAVAEQKIWPFPRAREEEGLSIFARVGGAPTDRNIVSFYLDGGVHVVGLLPGRPRDVAGVALSYSRISSALRRLTADQNIISGLLGEPLAPIPDFESVLEVTYRIEIKPWCYLQPDLQYIMHPGGSTKVPNALVLGLISTISF